MIANLEEQNDLDDQSVIDPVFIAARAKPKRKHGL